MSSNDGPTLESLRAALADASAGDDFSPPPRFQGKTFATYEIDPQRPGQATAVQAVQAFVGSAKRSFTDLFRRKRPRGCYLDGGFGVGKTHLLAAAWHAAPGSRHYLSFSEAISLAIAHGHRQAIDRLAADLVCIDEFELDDPSNTRLADLICAGLVEQGSRLLVTSNTVPGELGVGRLFVDQFRAQLVRISGLFTDIHVPGDDYRQRHRPAPDQDPPRWGPAAPPTAGPRHLVVTAGELDALLQQTPVIHLRRLARHIDRLSIIGLDTFPDQLPALRFVHLVDRCYDHRILLHVHAHCHLNDLFHPDYRDWAFAKKYRRCLSRLVECCTEEATP